MPAVSGSTDWTEYGLYPLKEQLSAYEQRQAVLMKAGYGNEDSPYYTTNYLPVYNAIRAINSQLVKINQQISDLQSSQAKISNQMSDIINIVSMNNNFTEEQLMELSRFIHEEELKSDNYVVTDSMTDDEKFEMLNDLLSYGEEELSKVAIPRLSFNANILNLFAIPEFDAFQGEFIPGNYIWVTLRDDFSAKAKLLTMRINWYDPTDFNVTFGNITRKAKSIFTDLAEAIKTATSAATSVSFNQSYWSAAAKNTDNIGRMLEDGLLSAGKYLSSGDDSEMLIDNRGIFVNTTSGPYANKDSIFMGGGRILFTEDNWKTVSMAVGRADVNGESKFGVFADFLIAGYVAGSTIEGSVIKGGEIIGTDFNNGNGTFHVDSNGNLTASSVDVTGKVTATSGSIGDFTIDHAIYNGKSSLTSTQNGVYIGKDGISLGANSVFKVTQNGEVIANLGTIGGASISNSSIHASNGNWYINSDGSASFKNIAISGNASYGSDVYHPFSGTAVTHITDLVVGTVTADYVYSKAIQAGFITADTIQATYATIGSLNAVSARVGTIEADYIKTNQLNAVSARVDNIEATYITASKVKTDYMEVAYWTSAGKIRADRIDANQLVAYFADIQNIQLGTVWIDGLNLGANSGGYFTYDGMPVKWTGFEVDGRTLFFLTSY